MVAVGGSSGLLVLLGTITTNEDPAPLFELVFLYEFCSVMIAKAPLVVSSRSLGSGLLLSCHLLGDSMRSTNPSDEKL